jgi:hypothetical protein
MTRGGSCFRQNFVNFRKEMEGGLVVSHWKAVDLDSAVDVGAPLSDTVSAHY